MAYSFSKRSETNLVGVHRDLVKVVRRALEISPLDFTVIEGLRKKSRQAELVKSGASQTMNSRHLTGHAVDIAPFIDGSISWAWPPFYQLETAMKQAAKELDIPIEWGGDWKMKDGPHWQLPWKEYP